MAGLFYYVPGSRSITEKTVREMGLGYMLSGRGLKKVPTSQGPDGHSGIVFAAGPTNDAATSINLTDSCGPTAKWAKVDGTDAWVGMYKEDKPTPQDLEHEHLIDGHFVELCDGHNWLCPVARAVDGSTPLPKPLEFKEGRWSASEGPVDKYADLFSHACVLWDTMMIAASDGEDGEISITFEDEIKISIIALACNYRVSASEVSLLGLFDSRSYTLILKTIVDIQSLEILKKKVPGLLSPEHGQPG